MSYNKNKYEIIKEIKYFSSTLIGAAALTAPVILSSCSSNKKII